MTDELTPNESAAVAEPTDEAAAEAQKEETPKLRQEVEIKDIGPCKKHIKVAVHREDIEKRFDSKFAELVGEAQVPGFRPGKAPRKVVVRRFQKEVGDQVKGELLLESLEQLDEEHKLAALGPPNINPNNLEIPKEGPFIYEFDIEVRPEFELPNYKGLKLKRPVHTFTDEDVAREERRILAPYGQVVPKPEGNAQIGDYLIADMTTRFQDQVIGTAKETALCIDDTLTFKDGIAEHFAEQTVGSNPGDTRTFEITLTDVVANPQLRGQKVQAILEIKDIKKVRLPELTHDFMHHFGVHTPEQLREQIRILLEKRLEYQQRQSAREQVLHHIAASATWELPEDMLIRQVNKTMARKVMEMREAGMSEEEIRARQRLLQRDAIQSTAIALKEHFVLVKIAEVEKIEIDDDEIEAEIERIADQTKQSPRRVRAQLEKEELMDTLATQMIERKALDLILENAEYEDEVIGQEKGLASVEEQAVPGEMADPGKAPEEAKPASEESQTPV